MSYRVISCLKITSGYRLRKCSLYLTLLYSTLLYFTLSYLTLITLYLTLFHVLTVFNPSIKGRLSKYLNIQPVDVGGKENQHQTRKGSQHHLLEEAMDGTRDQRENPPRRRPHVNATIDLPLHHHKRLRFAESRNMKYHSKDDGKRELKGVGYSFDGIFHRELLLQRTILKRVEDRMKEKKENNLHEEQRQKWKIAAMTLDKLFLWLFLFSLFVTFAWIFADSPGYVG